MNRPVKKYINSDKNLPFALLLHPIGDNKRMWPYPVDLVTKIDGADVDFYVNTGKSKIRGYEMGYTMVLDRRGKPVRNRISLHSYIYEYKFTLSDKRVAL